MVNEYTDQILKDAAIDKVLMMEDRAQVTRVCQVDLKEGRNRLLISPVTPLIADRTIRCRVRPSSTLAPLRDEPKLHDIQVQRRYVLQQARSDKVKEIDNRYNRIRDEYLKAYDQIVGEIRKYGMLGDAASALNKHIRLNLIATPFDEKWSDELKAIFLEREKAESTIFDHQLSLNEQLLEWKKLETQRKKMLSPTEEYKAEMVLEIGVSQSGSYLIEIDYQVPCALWRPIYTAQLMDTDSGTKLHWRSSGMAWQLTGEDWLNINLEFSTARPAMNAELPLLIDDILEVREKDDEEKKVVEVSSREEVIEKTAGAEVKSSETPPGLDDGGEVRTYKVSSRVNVSSDGMPHQLEFERWESDVTCSRVCYPEKARFAFLKSLCLNPSKMPILSGPVSLIRNGGYIGRSEISYVSSGEPIDLSWGSDDSIVVLRDVADFYEETGLRKKRHYRYQINIYLANQSNEKQVLLLSERVPIAEIEQVDVLILEQNTTPGYKKDEFGLVTWLVELLPDQEKNIELSFEVNMPRSVVWKP